MTEKSDWLTGLEEGDLVVEMSANPFDRHGRLATVARFTPKQIVTQHGRRFRRDSGDCVGDSCSYRSWIEEPTAERETAVKADDTLRQVESIRWKDVPVATLEAVLALVAKAGKAKR